MKLLTPFLFLFLSITMLAAATSSRAERITVTSLADNGGAGELRAAISAANASPGATITFQDGLSGTITLTSGLPDITTSLWILGPGASTIKIDGAHTCRPFFESAAGNDTLTISGLTIQNGSDQSDSAITGGGAIFVETGSLAVNGCVLIGNIASTYGGAIYGSPSGETLIDCTVSSNSSRDSGGAIYGYTGPLTLTNCTVSQNQAGASGGAIEGSSAALTLTDCTLSGNSASDAGAIDNNSPSAILTGCTLSNNTAVDSGGAIYSATGPINLTDCLLSANSAALAGAFVNVGSGTFTNCTFSNNSSNGDSGYGGGAVFNSLTTSSVSFKDCTGYSNSTSTEAGGFLYNYEGAATFTNCTLTGNQAAYGGGAIYNDTGTLELTNCTLSGNSSPVQYAAGGITTNSGATLTNCILYGDDGGEVSATGTQPTAGNCDIDGGVGGATEITDGGGNKSSDPLLGALAENGGFTETMALGAASPCLGAGNASLAPSTDQRGVPRPNPPSIGAFDSGEAAATYTLTPQFTLTGTLSPNIAQMVASGGTQEFTADPDSGYTFAGWLVDGNAATGSFDLTDGTIVTVSGPVLTFSMVSGGHSVAATFTPITYALTPQATTDGVLSPSDTQTVDLGAGAAFIALPAQGYVLNTWTVDGKTMTGMSVLADGTTVSTSGANLTFSNVQGSHTVWASFVETFTLTPNPTTNGTLSPNSVVTVFSGVAQTFTATPSAGYGVSAWTVDGTAVASPSSTLLDGTTVTIAGTSTPAVTLTFAKVQGSHTVGATFVAAYEGDVLNADKVTLADWVKIGRFAAGLDPQPTGLQFEEADCAPKGTLGSGKAIGLADWVQAGRYAAGLDPLTAIGGPTALGP